MKTTFRATFWTSPRRWTRPVAVLAFGFAAFTTALAQELKKGEIKLFVVEDKIDEARKQIDKEFKPEGPIRHQIYFFDTAALVLYGNADGPVILRARKKGTETPQSTVKLRREKRDPDLEKKLAAAGLKFEIEPEAIVGKKEPPGFSYSVDADPGRPLCELDGASGETISGWFSADQKKFLQAAGIKVDWGGLRVFGRIDADVWDWKEK
ncbi:MAG TPA: hypothetical protein VEX43_02480, partial [Chthoniobacterales bacterium]|nr:hypothetical protein [Chthoniobacterales bacterium]